MGLVTEPTVTTEMLSSGRGKGEIRLDKTNLAWVPTVGFMENIFCRSLSKVFITIKSLNPATYSVMNEMSM